MERPCASAIGSARRSGTARLRRSADPALLSGHQALLLPDRHALLRGLHDVAGRLVGLGAMRTGDDDPDARLARRDVPRAMTDGGAYDGPALTHFGDDPVELCVHHLRVRRVLD